MAKLIVPRIQYVTQMLDRPSIEQSGHGDILRGEKHAWLRLVDLTHRAAGIRNPFDQYALGLLRVLANEQDMPVPREHQEPTMEAATIREVAQKRTSYPV
jgi:hypothetical protein